MAATAKGERRFRLLHLHVRKRVRCYYCGMENWNDLKLVLAIARAGTLGGGATALGVNHSTAFRRLNALEEKLGVRLFERLPGGVYQTTTEGERVATTAERVETEADALSREVGGRDQRLVGALRVTSSETLAYSVLTQQLARFREAHPGIVVELVVDNRVLSLSRREADIALRAPGRRSRTCSGGSSRISPGPSTPRRRSGRSTIWPAATSSAGVPR